MKTRLLALVLACLMVLSVMPVVVFAEDTCEFARTDGDHTLVTCPDAEYIKTVKPQCGDKWGYDLFKCPGCSEFFADNFVKPVHDAHALELVEKGTESTCEVAGKSAKYVCANCDYVEGGVVLPLLEHDWQRTNSETGDCESEALISFKCSRCGYTKTEGTKKTHSWITPPAIIEKPYLNEAGELVNGLARYTCDLCGKTKDVVIIAEHDCDLKKVDAKAATCVTAGNIEYWQCQHPNCGKIYADANATTELTAEQTVVATGAHDLKKVDAKPATCDKATQTVIPGNIEYYHCELCGKNFADENATTELTDDQIVAGDHAWREEGYVAPTCDKWGGTRYICGNCGAIKNNDPEEPLGHTSYDDATSTDKSGVINFTCQGGGERTWNCGRCGEAQKEAVAKHELKKAEFAATCTNFAYSFNYCTECDATNQAPTKMYKDVEYDLSVPVLDAAGNYTYDANGNLIRRLYVVVGDVTFGEATDETNHNWIVKDTNKPTCTTDGDKVWYCTDCTNVFFTEVVPAFHSVPQGTGVVTPATCTTDAYTTYLCAVCGQNYVIVDKDTATGHSELVFDYTVAPTCNVKGYDVYKCTNEGCTYTENRNYVSEVEYILGTFYTKIEGDNTYATLDAYKDIFVGYFKDVHVNATLDEENGIHIQGNCNRLGLYRYFCPDCETYILVAMPGTGLGHQNDGVYDKDGEVAPVEATCTADGSKGTYKCTECGEMVSINPTNLNKLGHSMTKVTNVPADKCDIGYWSCSACNGLFTDAEGKTAINSFLNHDDKALDGRTVTCEKFAYKHYSCKNCNKEYINSYADALDHNWDKTEGKAPTCIDDGAKDLWQCDRDCCDVEGGKIHEENNGAILPATGIHKNAENREFTDKCTDTETLRECVVCQNYIERVHHYHDPVTVDATCIEYGYNLFICKDCGDDKIEKINDGALGDHDMKDDWAAIEGNSNIEQRFCHTEGCDYYEERLIAEVEYFVDIENTLGNVGFTDSSLIAVVIKIKADKPVWGVRFDVKYDENLTFVGAEGLSEKLNRNFDANDNGEGTVTVAAGASNSTDKKPANVIIEGKEELAVLYFRVTLPLDETGLPVIGADENDQPIVGFGKTTTTVTVVPVDAWDKDHDDLLAKGDAETIEILPFMDVNLDGDVNMNDALYMYEILLAVDDDNITTDYDVALDIDKNGKIEAADYIALYRYLVHAWTYEYMTQIGVPAEELA